ncbi:MAG: hypothetical protein OSA99_11650 [Acidimicrobiales bacterium]|nr:hypothetical protein [Acidimicrobiales bacterium]
MAEDDELTRWREDESVLAAIGAILFDQETAVEVRIPRALADAALAAWQREDHQDDFDPASESCEDRIVRHHAGTLALIGAALEDRGRADRDEVIVRLDAWFVGDSLNAADDRDMIGR